MATDKKTLAAPDLSACMAMGERGRLQDACKSWKKYKGHRKPKCCGGNGCVKCWQIYEAAKGYA